MIVSSNSCPPTTWRLQGEPLRLGTNVAKSKGPNPMRKLISTLPFLTLCAACSTVDTGTRPVRVGELPPIDLVQPCDTSNEAITSAEIIDDLYDAIDVVTGQRDVCAGKVAAMAQWRKDAAERLKGDDE